MDYIPWDQYLSQLGLITPNERNLLLDELPQICCRTYCTSSTPRQHLLPKTFKTYSGRLTPEDVSFTTLGGTFSVPCDYIRKELVTVFLKHVFPLMPVVSLEDLGVMAGIVQPSQSGYISLLLFHAVLFSSSHFANIEVLHDLGFQMRRQACSHFYSNTKRLLQLGYENDLYSAIPSMLILSLRYESEKHEKSPRYWIDLATNSANSLGLNRANISIHPVTTRQRLGRRIWWSCYIRDRLVSLTTLTPLSIKDYDSNIPMLNADDFEHEEEYRTLWCEESVSYNHWRRLRHVPVRLAKLCVCIGHVLNALYTPAVIDCSERPENTKFILKSKEDTIAVEDCVKYLRCWKASDHASGDHLQDPQHTSDMHIGTTVHHTFLQLVYSATMIMTYGFSPLQNPSTTLSRTFAAYSAQLIGSLQYHGLIRFLPIAGVATLIPCVVLNLQDITCGTTSNYKAAMASLSKFMEAMEELQETYRLADYIMDFVRSTHLDLQVSDLEDRSDKSVIGSELAGKINIDTLPVPRYALSNGEKEMWQNVDTEPHRNMLNVETFWGNFHFAMIEYLGWFKVRTLTLFPQSAKS